MNFWNVICSILRVTWKTFNVLREIVLNVFFLILVLLVWTGYTLIMNKEPSHVYKQEGLLVMDIQGSVVDNPYYDQDFYLLRSKLYGKDVDLRRENSLFDITRKLDQASKDKNIKGLILKLDSFVGADIPSLQYIGKYLNKFKSANKPVYAISTNYNKAQYYLASYANTIYIPAQGAIDLYGFSTNGLYYKSLLDKLKVTPYVFRVGAYKSAVEPFIRDDMSDAARENTTRWLNGLWNNYIADIAKNRNVPAQNLFPNADLTVLHLKEAGGSLSTYAHNTHLIDLIKPCYQFNQDMKRLFGNIQHLSIYNYLLHQENTKGTPEIGVVFISGTLVDGSNTADNTGNHTIIKQLQSLAHNPNTKAIIIRVNSPGGSVTASEDIRSEIEALRQKHIPVVISMGGMAASGGYWVSTASDYIIAAPTTITGSIGIFGIIPTVENSLANIGVHSDGVTTSPLADATIFRSLPAQYQQLTQLSINNGYQTFLTLVSKARHIDIKDVDKIAQGQVWLGQEAKMIGLVDQLGDFDDAVNKALQLAKLKTYRINWLRPPSSWLNSLFFNISSQFSFSTKEIMSQYVPKPLLREFSQQTELWNNLTDPNYQYSYCLTCEDAF